MSTLFIKKFIKVPKVPLRNFFREIGRNAFVDWLLILILNVSISVALIIGGIYLYWQIYTGNFVSSESTKKASDKVFEEKDLNSIISLFLEKEEASRKARVGYGIPNDPSL